MEDKKLYTVKEIAMRADTTVRTLQYYDRIGLLKPVSRSETGYRQYDDESLKRLQSIKMYKKIGYELKEVVKILDDPEYDLKTSLQQILEKLKTEEEQLACRKNLALGLIRELTGEVCKGSHGQAGIYRRIRMVDE